MNSYFKMMLREAECLAITDNRLIIAQMSIDLCLVSGRPNNKLTINSERLANDRALPNLFAIAVQNRFCPGRSPSQCRPSLE